MTENHQLNKIPVTVHSAVYFPKTVFFTVCRAAIQQVTWSHPLNKLTHSAFSNKKSNSRLFFPAAIPNLAPVIFCKPVKDQC